MLNYSEQARDYLKSESSRCVGCRQCLSACDILAAVQPLAPGALIKSFIAGEENPRINWFIPHCSLCGACVVACDNKVDVPQMMVQARSLMIEQGKMNIESYRAMWIDYDYNAISLYRDVYGLDFSHLIKDKCDIAYLPGCSLINEAPELVEPVMEWLDQNLDGEVGLLLDCCGMPLQEMGLLERFDRYEEELVEKLKSMGVSRLIVACPNCLGRLAHLCSRQGIRIQLVYEPMAAMGLLAPIQEGKTLTVHDSCPARGTEAGEWVRTILSQYPIKEMEHSRDQSLCCGSGGAVGMFDYVLRDKRANTCMGEAQATGADCCVSYCMSCCNTMQSFAQDIEIRHVLELALGVNVDHSAYQERVARMWQGETGARCARLMDEAKPCGVSACSKE